jgi:IS5 family transposase
MLLLCRWFSISDSQVEQQVRDRFSFRRFLDLPLEGDVPDHSTLSRFRDRLEEQNLDRSPLEEVDRQLAAKGFEVKSGNIIDPSLARRGSKVLRKPKIRQ